MEYVSQNDAIIMITDLIHKRRLVPVFGAGISMDYLTKQGYRVPDANRVVKLIREMVLKNNPDFTENDIGDDFNEVTDFLYRKNSSGKYFVSREDKLEFFSKYFVDVEIRGYQQSFLQLDWPYAYTLNVDDGIENSSEFSAVMPYRRLNSQVSGQRLYKLHGDAGHEVNYQDNDNIVFTNDQYITVLSDERNKDFNTNLSSDYSHSNMLFIGCSLRNEPDLKYIHKQLVQNESISPNSLRIALRISKPSKREEISLQNDYGINRIVMINDFPSFYSDIVNNVNEINSSKTIYSFTSPKITMSKGKEAAIKSICSSRIFDEHINEFRLTELIVNRFDIIKRMETELANKPMVILKGQRFSGKTILLAYVCQRMSRYEVLYFPSSIQIDETVLSELLKNKKNALFIFDSNSLSMATYHMVLSSIETFLKNDNKVIYAINATDNFVFNSSNDEYSKKRLEQIGLIEILNKFYNEKILQSFNKQADKLGLVQRQKHETHLDYLFSLSKKQAIKNVFSIDVKSLTIEEMQLIVLLCAKDKIYASEIFAMYRNTGIGIMLSQKLNGVIEYIDTAINEVTTHSDKKIVHNSKYALQDVIEKMTADDVVESIKAIVKAFKNDRERRRIYQDLVMFDTLNQLFGRAREGKKAGAGNLILRIYDELEEQLNTDLHYWLQRSKSIYRLHSENMNLLENAFEYASKAYADSFQGGKLKFQSAWSSALIAALIHRIHKSNNSIETYYLETSIERIYEAIYSGHFGYGKWQLNDELKVRLGKIRCFDLISEICNDCETQSVSAQIKDKASGIMGQFEWENRKKEKD